MNQQAAPLQAKYSQDDCGVVFFYIHINLNRYKITTWLVTHEGCVHVTDWQSMFQPQKSALRLRSFIQSPGLTSICSIFITHLSLRAPSMNSSSESSPKWRGTVIQSAYFTIHFSIPECIIFIRRGPAMNTCTLLHYINTPQSHYSSRTQTFWIIHEAF